MTTRLVPVTSPLFRRLARDILAEGNDIRFTARGLSMAPFVRDGDVLTVEPASAETLRKGDIVLYDVPPGLVAAHRLLNRVRTPDGPRLVVCGDNQVESSAIAPDQVLGRVTLAQGAGGSYRPARWINRKAALAASDCRRAWRRLRARFCRQPEHV